MPEVDASLGAAALRGLPAEHTRIAPAVVRPIDSTFKDSLQGNFRLHEVTIGASNMRVVLRTICKAPWVCEALMLCNACVAARSTTGYKPCIHIKVAHVGVWLSQCRPHVVNNARTAAHQTKKREPCRRRVVYMAATTLADTSSAERDTQAVSDAPSSAPSSTAAAASNGCAAAHTPISSLTVLRVEDDAWNHAQLSSERHP